MLNVMTVEETARLLRVSHSTVYRLLKNRTLPGALRIGTTGTWRIDRGQIEKWIANQQAAYHADGHHKATKRTTS